MEEPEPLVFHVENELKINYTLGSVVFYEHPDYDLKLIGRVISLLSHKPPASEANPSDGQTVENSFAVIHQMDWIEQSQFSDLHRIRVPGVLEFIDTNRAIEVPLVNIKRHFPCYEVLDADDYSKSTILKEFSKNEKQFNPIIVKNFLICDWSPSGLYDHRFLADYEDIIPCCSPATTILWEASDLTDPCDEFYNSCIPQVLWPLLQPTSREHSVPNLWSDIVAQNPDGLQNNKIRNRRIAAKKIKGREEDLIDPRAYKFLFHIVKDLQTMKEQITPAAVVSLYLKKLTDDLLPKFIDAIDNTVIALTKEEDDEEEEAVNETYLEDDDLTDEECDAVVENEEPDREDDNKPAKRQKHLIEEETLVNNEEDEEDDDDVESTDEEDEWDSSEEDTDGSDDDASTNEKISVYTDTEEPENFL